MHYFTLEQRETLQRMLEQRAGELREEIGEERLADLNEDREVAVLQHEVTELREVEAALERLHKPAFGVCADCEVDIPYSRLLASPFARRCVACQAKAERS